MATSELALLTSIPKTAVKSSGDVVKAIETLISQNNALQKKIDAMMLAQAVSSAKSLCSNATDWNGHKLVKARVDVDMNQLRNIASALKDIDSEMVAVMGGVADGKPALCLMIPQTLVNEKGMDAGKIALQRGMKLKTVQTQIYRARSMLRKLYGKEKGA